MTMSQIQKGAHSLDLKMLQRTIVTTLPFFFFFSEEIVDLAHCCTKHGFCSKNQIALRTHNFYMTLNDSNT